MSKEAAGFGQMMFNSLPSGIVIVDDNRDILAINEFQKIMFHIRDDVESKNLFDIGVTFMTVDDKPIQFEEYPFSEAKKSGKTVTGFEHKVRLRSGEIIYVSLNTRPFADSLGRKVLLISYYNITHHQQTEKRLLEQKFRLEKVITNEPLILFELDKEGVFTLTDGKSLASLGLEPGEVVGQSVFELYKDFPSIVDNMKKGLKGETVVFTAELYGLVFDTIITPIFDENKNLQSLIGVSIEQTEKVGTERKLEEIQSNLINVVQNTPVIIFSLDNRGIISFIEGYGLKALNLEADDLTGANIYDFFKDSIDILNLIDRVLAGETFSAKLNFNESILSTSFKPIFDKNDNLIGATGVAFDITELEKSEQKLSDSNQRLDEAQHIAHVGNWTWNMKDNEMTGSAEAFSLFGVSETKGIITYNDLMDLIHPDDKDRSIETVKRAIDEQREYTLEHRVLVPGDTDRIVLTKGRVVADENGEPLRLVGTIQDVTEARLAEEELRTKDKKIREAYSDVFSAVTGDKLLIMTSSELDGSLGEQVGDRFYLSDFADLSKARDHISGLVDTYFPDTENSYDVIVSAGEIMTNAIKHAGGCEVAIYKNNSLIQLKITDSGPGIDFSILPKATLVPGFSTEQSLGLGFSIILEICSRVLLTTQPGHTSLVLELEGSGLKKEDAA